MEPNDESKGEGTLGVDDKRYRAQVEGKLSKIYKFDVPEQHDISPPPTGVQGILHMM
jgi:hypothetical protein